MVSYDVTGSVFHLIIWCHTRHSPWSHTFWFLYAANTSKWTLAKPPFEAISQENRTCSVNALSRKGLNRVTRLIERQKNLWRHLLFALPKHEDIVSSRKPGKESSDCLHTEREKQIVKAHKQLKMNAFCTDVQDTMMFVRLALSYQGIRTVIFVLWFDLVEICFFRKYAQARNLSNLLK